MSNKKLGNDFESNFCEVLFGKGFWVHNFAQNQAGQPSDVIAARNGKTYLIDCKVCSNGFFDLSRMEENQNLSMELWEDCGNGGGWFALLLNDHTIIMIPHSTVISLKRIQSSMGEEEIRKMGILLNDWLWFS